MMIHYHRLLLTFGRLFCIVSVHFISIVQILINLSCNLGVQTSSESRQAATTNTQSSGRWDQHLGLFKSSSPADLPTDRHALTATLIHFSRTLG